MAFERYSLVCLESYGGFINNPPITNLPCTGCFVTRHFLIRRLLRKTCLRFRPVKSTHLAGWKIDNMEPSSLPIISLAIIVRHHPVIIES